MTSSLPSQLQNRPPFKVDWVLFNELALGIAPIEDRHTQRLINDGIKAVLSLCDESEAPPPASLHSSLPCRRLVLPDHRTGRLPEFRELTEALSILGELHSQYGAVFVHCVAAMERSPLVCLAWIVQNHRLSPTEALDYLMQVHPGTNPLPGQLALLHQLSQNRTNHSAES